jgi:hypothetical protein
MFKLEPMTVLKDSEIATPALRSALLRAYDRTKVCNLLEVYKAVEMFGGSAETSTRRTPGTSFNPRPARVVLIGLQNDLVGSDIGAAALMLATISPTKLKDLEKDDTNLIPRSLITSLPLANSIQVAPQASDTAEILRLASCITLDLIRHLHLSEGHDTHTYLHQASELAEILERDPDSKKILNLLKHAINQQRMILRAAE